MGAGGSRPPSYRDFESVAGTDLGARYQSGSTGATSRARSANIFEARLLILLKVHPSFPSFSRSESVLLN